MTLVERLRAAQLRGNTVPADMHLLEEAADRIAELEQKNYDTLYELTHSKHRAERSEDTLRGVCKALDGMSWVRTPDGKIQPEVLYWKEQARTILAKYKESGDE